MKLSSIVDSKEYDIMSPFSTDGGPVLTIKQIRDMKIAYHVSDNPNLAITGILTRGSLGLDDLHRNGHDSTHQDSVYLGVSPEIIRQVATRGSYVYAVNISKLDKTKFAADEDAEGHCYIKNVDWISSLMCMGTFRYVGDIQPNLVRLVASSE